MQKFQACQDLASIAANQARHAAGEVLVGLQVGENQFLSAHDAGRDWHQSAPCADVDGLRVFGKRLAVELAVHLHGQVNRQTLRPALIVQGTDHFLARLLVKSAAARPSKPGEKLRPAHKNPKKGMRPSELTRKEFRWREVTQRSHHVQSARTGPASAAALGEGQIQILDGLVNFRGVFVAYRDAINAGVL
jgi:hypothetical protein